jgi:uncharacterized protein (DUF2147 family)
MRAFAFLVFTIVGATMLPAPALAADSIQGKWYTSGKRAIVTIAPCGKKLCGKLTRFIEKRKDGVTTDLNNPEPAMRKRKLVGLAILTGFVPEGEKWNGSIYDPESGKTYRSIVSHGAPGTLNVEGCISVFCQTQTWTKVR